jgi:hypothetical protein
MRDAKPQELGDLAAARTAVAAMRARVDRMRKDLYVPDPQPDSDVTARLSAFQARWGELAAAIVRGRAPSDPLPAARWNDLARSFSRRYCDARTVAAVAPPTGMPLRGYAWACLSDLFFHELAPIEAGVSRALTVKRAVATEPLERAMRAAESTLADTARLDPVPAFALRRIAERLVDVDRAGAELRLRELRAQRDAGEGSAAFRWLLDISRAVHRPLTVPKLTISVDQAKTDVAGTALPDLAKHADALHRAHYRLALLDLGTPRPEEERAALDVERARALFAVAQHP